MTIRLAYQSSDGDREYDLVLLAGGLDRDPGLMTAIIISLFTDAAATEAELVTAGLPAGTRGGWWGDTYPEIDGDVLGSKLWLLTRAKRDDATLELAKKYAEDALAWMLEDGQAEKVVIEPAWHESTGLLTISLAIQKPGELQPQWVALWEAIEGEVLDATA
ncbi:MAG: phage GP46 family protein [Myxococcales bacterium]|nr:phage GP46 family protein [Myxococcales bacterium]